MTTPKCPLCKSEVNQSWVSRRYYCTNSLCNLSAATLTLDEIRRLTQPTDEQIADGLTAVVEFEIERRKGRTDKEWPPVWVEGTYAAFRNAAWPSEQGGNPTEAE